MEPDVVPEDRIQTVCWFPSENTLIYDSDLPDIERRAVELSFLIFSVNQHVTEMDYLDLQPGTSICFGRGSPEKRRTGSVGDIYMDLNNWGHSPAKP